MLYAVEQGPVEKTIFEQHVKYKTPLPEVMLNAPILHPSLNLYFIAFNRLSTNRNSVMGLGQITYFSCLKYCDEHDICDNDEREYFADVLLLMDEAYLKHMSEKEQLKRKKGKKNGKSDRSGEIDETDGSIRAS